MKRKIFVKTNDNRFEECYLKSFVINPTWIPNEYNNIDNIVEVQGNGNIRDFERRYFFDSIESVKSDNRTYVRELTGCSHICSFINKRLKTEFEADGNKHTMSITLYRWEGNHAKGMTFDLRIFAYISGFIYDYDTDNITLKIISMPPAHCEYDYGVMDAIMNGKRTLNIYGWKYYFTKEECENGNQLIIHTMDCDGNGKEYEEEALRQEYERKLEQLNNEYDEKLARLRK